MQGLNPLPNQNMVIQENQILDYNHEGTSMSSHTEYQRISHVVQTSHQPENIFYHQPEVILSSRITQKSASIHNGASSPKRSQSGIGLNSSRSKFLADSFVAQCETERQKMQQQNVFNQKKKSVRDTSAYKSPLSAHRMQPRHSYRSNSIIKSNRSASNLSAYKKRHSAVVMVPLTEDVIKKEMMDAFNGINLECYNDLLRIKKP